MFKTKNKLYGYEEKNDNFVLNTWEIVNSNEHL